MQAFESGGKKPIVDLTVIAPAKKILFIKITDFLQLTPVQQQVSTADISLGRPARGIRRGISILTNGQSQIVQFAAVPVNPGVFLFIFVEYPGRCRRIEFTGSKFSQERWDNVRRERDVVIDQHYPVAGCSPNAGIPHDIQPAGVVSDGNQFYVGEAAGYKLQAVIAAGNLSLRRR